uniref:Spartin (inferred by orthology to a human protein) n=1 Tax=Anisakis simplex TaxID=6269 RepID=A0A0M3J9T5_ANISI
LIPQQTPVLKNDIGAYVVSNPTPEHPKDFFKSLKQFTEVRTEDIARRSLSQDEQKRLSHKIATLLIKGSSDHRFHSSPYPFF